MTLARLTLTTLHPCPYSCVLVPWCSLPQGLPGSGKYRLLQPIQASGSPKLRVSLEQAIASPQTLAAPSQVDPGQELTRVESAFYKWGSPWKAMCPVERGIQPRML